MADFFDDVNWVDVTAVASAGTRGINITTEAIMSLEKMFSTTLADGTIVPKYKFGIVPRPKPEDMTNQLNEYQARNWRMLRVKHLGESSVKKFNENSPLRMQLTPEQGEYGGGVEAPLRLRNSYIVYIDAALDRRQRGLDENTRENRIRAEAKALGQKAGAAPIGEFTETQVKASDLLVDSGR